MNIRLSALTGEYFVPVTGTTPSIGGRLHLARFLNYTTLDSLDRFIDFGVKARQAQLESKASAVIL